MDGSRLTSMSRRFTAVTFAFALVLLSAEVVMCIEADGHLSIERPGAGCCLGAPSRSTLGSDALHVSTRLAGPVEGDCSGCSDVELGGPLIGSSGVSAAIAPLAIAVATAPAPPARAFLPVLWAPRGPIRDASLEFARVVSLRC